MVMSDTLAFETIMDDEVDHNDVDPEVETSSDSGSDDLDSDSAPRKYAPDELAPAIRGKCRVLVNGVRCSNPAHNGRAMYCAEHLPQQFASPSLGAPSGPKGITERSETSARRSRAKGWAKVILKANPQIVQGAQWLASIPEPWMDGIVATVQVGINEDGSPKVAHLWEPSLREQLEITEKQAQIFAEGLVQFSESSVGKSISKTAENAAPFINLAMASGVAILYVVKLGKIKAQVEQLKSYGEKAKQEAAAAAQQPGIPVNEETYNDLADVG